MSMQRLRLFITSLLVGVLVIFGLQSFAATTTVKAGATCSKVGTTAVVKTLKYTCIKSGKKLIWSKGEIVKVAGQDLSLVTPAYVPVPPSGGTDEYRCFLLDPKFAKETFVKSVTITPDNMKVSHHGILYRVSAANVQVTKSLDEQSEAPGWSCFGDTGIPGATAFTPASPSSWISFWAPGGNFKTYPEGTGMRFTQGDQFILQSHFMVMPGNSDKDKRASMTVALAYAKSTVADLKTMLVAAPIEVACAPNESGPLCLRANALADLAWRTSDKAALQGTGLLIICGQSLRPVPSPISECTQSINSSITIYGATPHMHQLGKSIEIVYTNGSTGVRTEISSRPLWNFDDQRTDWLSKPITANAGDSISVRCTFDVGLRSQLPLYKNLSPNYVVWGEGTRDEMCLAIVNYTNQ
jgi:hypothetical protein